MHLLKNLVYSIILFSCSTVAMAAAPVMLQILGSGGPNDVDGRASSGYLLWVDNKARVMVEAGGGTSMRYGQTGANFHDLDLIAVSHLHVDHSVDVITMLKRGYFYGRERALPIAGPSGNELYPDVAEFITGVINKDGPYRYMTLCEGYPIPEPMVLDAGHGVLSPVLENEDYKITALGVEHANTPTVAYRIDTPQGSVAFSGDQNGTVEEFIDFVKDVDILVMHSPTTKTDNEIHNYWHTGPELIAQIAQQANVKKLVLSHFMVHSLNNMATNLAIIQETYKGPVILARDLQTFTLPT